MHYRLAADAIVGLHFAFILWAVLGALTLLWRRALAWIHLPALVWAAYIEFSGSFCPLTPLEKHFRQLAGEAGYGGGFIQHYIVSVVYPQALTRNIQLALGAMLITVNIAFYVIAFSRRARRAPTQESRP